MNRWIEYGYRYADGTVLPMGLTFPEEHVEKYGRPIMLSTINGEPVEQVQRTVTASEWENLT